MEPHARRRESSFDPRVDDPAWREAQRQQLADFAKELEAEHGPVDPDARARLRERAENWPA